MKWGTGDGGPEGKGERMRAEKKRRRGRQRGKDGIQNGKKAEDGKGSGNGKENKKIK